MPAFVESSSSTQRFSVPWNLSEWSSNEQVLAWTREEIGALDWNNPELAALQQNRPAWRPQPHLELLVFAYAIGVCGAEEVEGLCYTDSLVKAAFPGLTPSAKSLSRFRVENHGLIRWCLEQVFKRAVRAHFELGEALVPAGVKRVLRDSAGVRTDAARHLDRATHDE